MKFEALTPDEVDEVSTRNASGGPVPPRDIWYLVTTIRSAWAERDALRAEVERQRLALGNVLAMAQRIRHRMASGKLAGDEADHLIRFCASADVVPTVLRVESPPEPER